MYKQYYKDNKVAPRSSAWQIYNQFSYSMYLVSQLNRDIHLDRVDNRGVLKAQCRATRRHPPLLHAERKPSTSSRVGWSHTMAWRIMHESSLQITLCGQRQVHVTWTRHTYQTSIVQNAIHINTHTRTHTHTTTSLCC